MPRLKEGVGGERLLDNPPILLIKALAWELVTARTV